MDFLTFKSFISIQALIIFYYLGAVIMPISIWFFLIWILRKYPFVGEAHKKGQEVFWQSLSKKLKIKLVSFFVVIFLFMELFWRMLFEFLIAYMQMRDALLQSSLS